MSTTRADIISVVTGVLVGIAVVAAVVILFPDHAAVAQIPNTTTTVNAPGTIPVTPPVTQNTVTTTGPVSSDTTISVGTLAGQVLTWLAAAFSIPIGGLLSAWLLRLFKLAGVQVTQQMSDQLDRTLVNGLNDAATRGAAAAAGKGAVQVKSDIVAGAIAYAQAHRAETIQALGLDPQSGAAVEALRARIATLVADPAQPTPAVLDAPSGPKPAA